MAAATLAATQERPHVLGDVKMQMRAYTALGDTNTDTFPAGTRILGVIVLQKSTTASVGATVAANVITYNVSAGTPDVTVGVLID